MLMMYSIVQKLTREINVLEKQAVKARNRLSHYQKYAGRLGGSTTLFAGNIAGLSSEIVPRATIFSQYAEQASSMSAMQQMQYMKAMGMVPWLNNPMMQYNYEANAFAQLKKQSMQALKQREIDAMSEIEKEIELELNTIESQIKSKQAMKESCQNRLKERVQDFVPKFGMG